MDFRNSETKTNLMRAFAGESQARNRYVFAASQAKKEHLHVIEAVFTFTAAQEKEHAEIFYHQMKELAGENITIDGAYPIDLYDSMYDVLKAAQHNEYEEYDPVYKAFGDKAKEEGFSRTAAIFHNISVIEKTHSDRFGRLAQMLKENKLFVSDVETGWMCLNCGYVFHGKEAPAVCPVCEHDRGYFIRLELTPFI
ncbi:rubrerythrin [Acetivibrio sp. MSJd-27]|uniref:rubrerythrin n=1 Tax=Acetivibrio sp. MSJd-27 TaxID=2841523 RepID=UPI001C105553|nr:rubrerythrin family protein [Acetivibrio sp. MSJd-27]MBU5449074.1 rubrerythrin family protein [Acetivibrio sp. MSJd-27]